MRPARPMVESTPLAMTDTCMCIPWISVAKTGKAFIFSFIP